jgi:hypothetical protein
MAEHVMKLHDILARLDASLTVSDLAFACIRSRAS